MRWAGTMSSTCSTSRETMSVAADRYGSLLSSGAVNGFGYHALPAACGAKYDQPACRTSEAMVMMSSAVAPRPWRRIIAARAEASGSPASTMRCPWAMLNAFLVCRQAESSIIRTHVSFTGVRGRWHSWAPSCRGWRRPESESSPRTL